MHNKIIGFSAQKENLPDFFDNFTSKEKLRQLFMNLISSLVKDYYSFSKYEQKNLSKYKLNIIFEHKIKSLSPISYVKKVEKIAEFNFCLASTLIINNYIKKENKIHLFSSCNLLPMAKMISSCYIKNKLELYFDKNILFHEFVLNKVKNLHKNKKVIDNGDSICIFDKTSTPLKIYTSWKSINTSNLDIKDELSNAVDSIKQSEFKQVYLVYPKMENFKRHIEIKVDELKNTNYQIKVIPYSLRSTLRKLKD